MLRKRDAIQMEYDMIVEELNRKKEDKEQVVILFLALLVQFKFLFWSNLILEYF